MRIITIPISAVALAGCTATFGSIPTVRQVSAAVDQDEGNKVLSTVNCEGRTECYNAAFGRTKVRNVDCAATKPREADCRYEIMFSDLESEWETRRSGFRVDVGPDGKIGWRLVPSAVN